MLLIRLDFKQKIKRQFICPKRSAISFNSVFEISEFIRKNGENLAI